MKLITYILFIIFLIGIILNAEFKEIQKGLEQVDLSEFEDLEQIDIDELIHSEE